MWHDQGKWVTCRQYSILSFQYNLLAHIKSYILIHTLLQSDIWFNRYEQFFEFQNIVKHRNMSSVLAYNSKSILATSDSFPWSCHIYASPSAWVFYHLYKGKHVLLFMIHVQGPNYLICVHSKPGDPEHVY